MKKLSFLLIVILFISCAGYRTSKFTLNSVDLGTHIESILTKYGKPFKIDACIKDKVQYQTLYYKEIVDVSNNTYILTSILSFKDSILVNFKQVEEYVPDRNNIKIVTSGH